MGIDLGKLLGTAVSSANPATGIVESAKGILSLFKKDPNIQAQIEARLTEDNIDLEKLKLAQTAAQLQGQLEINLAEAQKGGVLNDWRDVVGWVCATALAYNEVIQPFIQMVLTAFHWVPLNGQISFEKLDSTFVTTLLLPLLGLGGMKVYENTQNQK